MNNIKNDKIMKDLYENPLYSGNALTLYNNIQNLGIKTDLTLKDVRKWLNNTEYKQTAQKYKQRGVYIPIRPKQEYQLDVLYFIEPNSNLKQYQKYNSLGTRTFKLNKGFKYGIICIDIFTKYADIELLKFKKAKPVLEATLKIFKRMGNPESIYTDHGKEFLSVFQKKMEELNIKQISTMTHASFAERFIKTFKNKLYPYLNRLKTKTYYNIVDKIVENYNNSYHSVIKMTPREATNPKNEKIVRANINKYYLKQKFRKRDKLKIGDTVRFLIKQKGFTKDYEPSYSKEIATVEKFGDIYVRLSNGKDFLENELLKVNRPKPYTPKNLYEMNTPEFHIKNLTKIKTIKAFDTKPPIIREKSKRKKKKVYKSGFLNW